MTIIAALIFGAPWRLALGHDWSQPIWKIPPAPDWFASHARVILMTIGAVSSALFVWGAEGNAWAILCALVLTPAYFAIGNASIIKGPYNPGGWAYVRPILLKYIAPAIVAWGVLNFFGYLTALPAAGFIAAAGYWFFWKPDLDGTDPWNHKSEAVSGAAWFAFISLNLGGFV